MSTLCVVRRNSGVWREFTLVRRTPTMISDCSGVSYDSTKHEVVASCTSPEAIEAAWRLFKPDVPFSEAPHEEELEDVDD